MSSVKLLIRCAHLANADLKIEDARTDWTVRQLKIFLSDEHPSKPVPERQRLVFAGQLLRDEARLSEYFSRYDDAEPFVLHLVYTSSIDENVAAAQRRAKQQETELRQRKAPSTNSSLGQRQESVPSMPVSNSSPSMAQYWPWMAGQQVQMGASPDMANDWMRQQQQMYAAMMSQWYGQYMQAYGGAVGFYPVSPGQLPSMGFGTMDQPQQQAEPVAPQPQEAPRAQVPQQQAMNAQGGMAAVDMDDDEQRNRDWLDYLYMGCRASLLLMILYFYSSIERFVFVMLCCTVMYGLQAGWFGRRGQQQQNEQQPRRAAAPAAPVPVPGQAPNQAAAGEGDRERVDAVDAQGDQPERQQQGQDASTRRAPDQEMPMTAWNVFWTTCWTFISSFFASLVPERPPPLNM